MLTASQDVAGAGHTVVSVGHSVASAGQAVSSAGHQVSLTGQVVEPGGQAVDVRGQFVACTGQTVHSAGAHTVITIGHAVSIGGSMVASNANALDATPRHRTLATNKAASRLAIATPSKKESLSSRRTRTKADPVAARHCLGFVLKYAVCQGTKCPIPIDRHHLPAEIFPCYAPIPAANCAATM